MYAGQKNIACLITDVEHDQMQYKYKVPTYAEAKMGQASGMTHHICIDTGSAISIIDASYVKKYLPHAIIHPSSTIRLKGIGYNSKSGWISTRLHFLNRKANYVEIFRQWFMSRTSSRPRSFQGTTYWSNRGRP